MNSSLQYIHKLFINNKNQTTRSQYIIMISMLWMISTFIGLNNISMMSTHFFLPRVDAETIMNYTMLTSINNILVGIYIPWEFLLLIASFFCIRKTYRFRSKIITLLTTLLLFIFFRLLMALPIIVSGEISQLSTINIFTDSLRIVLLFIFTLGLIIALYPAFTLKSDDKKSTIDAIGITKEQFAEKVLFLNSFVMLVTLLLALLNLAGVKIPPSKEFITLASLFMLLLTFFSVYLLAQRLKNTQQILKPILFFIFSLVLPICGLFIFIYLPIGYLLLLASGLIYIGVNLLCLFVCYLYLFSNNETSSNTTFEKNITS